MSTVPSLPWWGWALVAFFVLNVVLRMDVGLFLPLIIGIALAATLGRGRGSLPSGPARPRPLPPRDRAGGSPGSSGPAAPGPGPRPPGPGPGAPGGMPRIEVPSYPGSAPSGSGTGDPGTDPVVSLGQLHLSRCARDLHTAATAGSAHDVKRVLDEVADQADRLQTQLGGAGATPGSGRREFEAGLRRLQRDVAAARGEDPPGAQVARVVRAAGAMGQTGRYE